jgi:hypothetical protein
MKVSQLRKVLIRLSLCLVLGSYFSLTHATHQQNTDHAMDQSCSDDDECLSEKCTKNENNNQQVCSAKKGGSCDGKVGFLKKVYGESCTTELAFKKNCKDTGGKIYSCVMKGEVIKKDMFNTPKCIPFGYKARYLYGNIATDSQSGNKTGYRCDCPHGSLKNGKCPPKCPTSAQWNKAKKKLIERGAKLKKAIMFADWSNEKTKGKPWCLSLGKVKPGKCAYHQLHKSNNNGVAQMLVHVRWSKNKIKKLIETYNACEH